MAQGVDHFAAAGKCVRDACMDRPEAYWIVVGTPRGAVLLNQWMQAHLRWAGTGCLQQTGQRAHRRNPLAGAAHPGGFFKQLGVEPVEQRKVENEVALRIGHAPPKAGFDPRGDRVTVDLRRRAFVLRVAVDAQRHRPSRGSLRDGIQLPTWQPSVEECGDFGFGEAQILDGNGRTVALEKEHRDVEPRRSFAVGHGEVEIRRRTPQQNVQGFDGRPGY